MRQPGYYWVKIGNDWEIAEWSSCWERIGYNATYDDSQMEEIDERRIERGQQPGIKLIIDRTLPKIYPD